MDVATAGGVDAFLETVRSGRSLRTEGEENAVFFGDDNDELANAFQPPSSNGVACAIYASLLDKRALFGLEEVEDNYVAVFEWIETVAGRANVHLHDIVLIPLQLKFPRLVSTFAQRGYDVEQPLAFSRGVVTTESLLCFLRTSPYVTCEDVEEEMDRYFQLLVHAGFLPCGRYALNALRLSCEWAVLQDVIVLRYHMPVKLGPLFMRVAPRTVSGARTLDATALTLLANLVDPLAFMQALPDIYASSYHCNVAEFDDQVHDTLDDLRSGLVCALWEDYPSFIKCLVAMERHVRRTRGKMHKLFRLLFVRNVAGAVNASVAEICEAFPPSELCDLSDRSSREQDRAGTVLYHGISDDLYPWIMHYLVGPDDTSGERAAALMASALVIWRARVASRQAPYWWGDAVFYTALLGDHKGGDPMMRLLYAAMPGQSVPHCWVLNAINRAEMNGRLEHVVSRLVDYGALDPRTFSCECNEWNAHPIDQEQLECALSLTERCGTMPDVDLIEPRLKMWLSLGAPLPRRAIVAHHWPPHAKSILENILK